MPWTVFIILSVQGSTDTIYIVSYYIKWVTTSWTYSNADLLSLASLSYTIRFRKVIRF